MSATLLSYVVVEQATILQGKYRLVTYLPTILYFIILSADMIFPIMVLGRHLLMYRALKIKVSNGHWKSLNSRFGANSGMYKFHTFSYKLDAKKLKMY